MDAARWSDEPYDFVKPGKVAWTKTSRFRDKRSSRGLIAAPMAGEAALDDVIDVLVHERGWRVVSRTEDGARLRRVWMNGERVSLPILLALLVVGILPGVVYLLACWPGKPVRGEMILSIAASDGEETIIEFVGGPFARLKRSVDAVADSFWQDDSVPLFA